MLRCDGAEDEAGLDDDLEKLGEAWRGLKELLLRLEEDDSLLLLPSASLLLPSASLLLPPRALALRVLRLRVGCDGDTLGGEAPPGAADDE